jgi:hypothetical protein
MNASEKYRSPKSGVSISTGEPLRSRKAEE